MKSWKVLLSLSLVLAFVVTGCTAKEENPEILDPNSTSVEKDIEGEKSDETINESDNQSEKTFLQSSLELLGKNHEESASYFGENEELFSADGVYLIGRSYPVKAFGIDTSLYTSLDTNNIVNSINMHLGEDNFDLMKEEIINELGEPSESNLVPSEAGYTNLMWDIDGKLVYLYKGYNTVDLQLILPYVVETSILDEDIILSLPKTIAPMLAEAEAHFGLRDFIINKYDIPEEYRAQTKYYYNYVDFNGDGNDEIFALVMGPYTSGSGGSSAFIAFEHEEKINEVTSFTLIHAPVIISNKSTKGMKDIIVMKSGGGANPEYVKLTSTGEGNYTSVNDGQVIENLDGISGKAIIANDLMNDIEKGFFLTLE